MDPRPTPRASELSVQWSGSLGRLDDGSTWTNIMWRDECFEERCMRQKKNCIRIRNPKESFRHLHSFLFISFGIYFRRSGMLWSTAGHIAFTCIWWFFREERFYFAQEYDWCLCCMINLHTREKRNPWHITFLPFNDRHRTWQMVKG